ncbi:golgin subfamily A member 6-like protein 6 [Anabrus simplex]|uniref:golgin subfamily A member 6-like protein 6 n=1 Tax=Anabrus simplex TaxID=316456 RepID=UPI0035A2C6B4
MDSFPPFRSLTTSTRFEPAILGSEGRHSTLIKRLEIAGNIYGQIQKLQTYECRPKVDKLQDKVKNLKDELTARDKLIEDLREKVRSLQMKLDEQEDVAKKPVRTPSCEKMKGELEALRKELALHSQMNASQVKIIENLQQSNSDTQAELKALQAKSNELEESRRSSTNQIMEHYKLQLQNTQDKLEQQLKENRQQAEKIALLQSSLETAKFNLGEAEERAREADRKLRRANEEQVSANERNKEKIEVLEGKVSAREAEVRVLEEKVDLLKNSLEQEQQRVINKIQEADKRLSTDRAAALEICREKLAATEELLDMKNRENLHQAHMIDVLQRGNTEAIQAKERAEEKASEVENNCYKKLQECEITVRGLKDENEILQQKLKDLQEALAESKRKNEEYAKQFKDLADCKTKLEELERLVDSQEKEAKQFEDYKAESEAKLKNLKAKISEYESKIPALESKIRLFTRENADKDAASEELKENLKASESELAQYKDKLQKTTMQLEALSKNSEEQQNEVEKLKREVKTLQSALKAKEKVTEDQKEELQIQQETLEMAQNELKELQNKLKELQRLQDEQEKPIMLL